jgi:hypothetical protein
MLVDPGQIPTSSPDEIRRFIELINMDADEARQKLADAAPFRMN